MPDSQPDRTPRRRSRGSLATVLVCMVIGLMISGSAIAARGTDLRPTRSGEIADLVTSQAHRIRQQNADLQELQAEVDALSQQAAPQPREPEPLTSTAVEGPGVRVTLTDAPDSINPAGVDADLLVVHQQDIQAVVNALWAGGAEAMTIQGQRVTATTGIKCVGNTVVLHEVPYAPPYRIEAIGDPDELNQALDASTEVAVYQEYAEAYSLGYRQETVAKIDAPAFEGSTQLDHARVG